MILAAFASPDGWCSQMSTSACGPAARDDLRSRECFDARPVNHRCGRQQNPRCMIATHKCGSGANGRSAEMLPINMDTLLIKEDSIPKEGRRGVLEPESAEVELPLAHAMRQLSA